ncbi:hypothetical protein A2U01_0090874, partial [Trifolium medium]|nr:hypothetical protein [Trifolium medium]
MVITKIWRWISYPIRKLNGGRCWISSQNIITRSGWNVGRCLKSLEGPA